jgi:hypothetical protein
MASWPGRHSLRGDGLALHGAWTGDGLDVTEVHVAWPAVPLREVGLHRGQCTLRTHWAWSGNERGWTSPATGLFLGGGEARDGR